MIIVLTTVSTQDEALKLAEMIVSAKLAACVQVLPRMMSIYFWEGEIKRDEEFLLLIKTLEDKYPELEKFIGDNHGYSVPEIVAIDAAKVSDAYLEWMKGYLT